MRGTVSACYARPSPSLAFGRRTRRSRGRRVRAPCPAPADERLDPLADVSHGEEEGEDEPHVAPVVRSPRGALVGERHVWRDEACPGAPEPSASRPLAARRIGSPRCAPVSSCSPRPYRRRSAPNRSMVQPSTCGGFARGDFVPFPDRPRCERLIIDRPGGLARAIVGRADRWGAWRRRQHPRAALA